uniref:DUF2188 domain-containing protein n=1 Tax=Desulfobacca acetoxidans TaxID=60893 RepID=A0A7V6A3B0_9BACT
MSKKSHHVVPAPQGGWNVKKSGDIKASKHFERKQDAIERARDVSRKQRTDLVIHKKDGTIASKTSHSRDPYPPRDRETQR